jgi:hypothetical protein
MSFDIKVNLPARMSLAELQQLATHYLNALKISSIDAELDESDPDAPCLRFGGTVQLFISRDVFGVCYVVSVSDAAGYPLGCPRAAVRQAIGERVQQLLRDTEFGLHG